MSNIYPFGQCTWWCANQDPWSLRYGNLGNALDWASHWREHGGYVQMTPAVGTIACFQPGSNGADGVFGHVAVVIAARGASFSVSEMNGPAGPGRTDDRNCKDNAGVSFLREFSPPPPPTSGDPMNLLYQGTNGTIYAVFGNTLCPLSTQGDVQVFLNAGWKLVTQSEFTIATQTEIAKLPKLS